MFQTFAFYIFEIGILKFFLILDIYHLEVSPRPGDVVVVTGGTRGIGASVVKMFLQAHMHVIIGIHKFWSFGLDSVAFKRI